MMASALDHHENNIEAIVESFTCFVCMNLAENPHHCLHCGKIGCFICFQECLNRNDSCPHCRNQLQIQQLRNFGWYTDVIDNLKALQCTDKCVVHLKALNLYCSDCRESICHNCVVLGEKHYGHALNMLEDVYVQHFNKIKREIDVLKAKLNNLLQYMAKGKEYGNSLMSLGKKRFQLEFDYIVKRYNKRLNKELERFVREESALDVAGIEDILQKSEEQLRNSSKFSLINTCSSITRDLQGAENKLENFVPPIDIDCPFEFLPSRYRKKFVVNNFTQVLQRGKRVYSDALKFDGQTWKIAVCPNISNSSKGKGYLGVAFQLCETIFPNVSAELQLEVEMFHGSIEEKNVTKHRVINCGPETREITIDNFCKIDSLSSGGYLNPKKDILEFEFVIQSTTVFEQCKKLELINNTLLEEQRIKDDKIQELEEKLKIQEAKETNCSTETVQSSEKTDMSGLEDQSSVNNNNDNEAAAETLKENTIENVYGDTCNPTVTNSRKRINAALRDPGRSTGTKKSKN